MWIQSIDETKAEGLVAEIYERARQGFGFVPDIVKVFSLRPQVAAAQEALRKSLLGKASSLGSRRAELVSAMVAGLVQCQYCGSAHSGNLVREGEYGKDELLALFRDWRSVKLPPAERAMLEFAEKLTYAPWTVEKKDVETLRQAGFTDENIYDIVLLTAYRNFLTRVIAGLGVPVDLLRRRFGDDFVDAFAPDATRAAESKPEK
jgi:uncharacterized peroxidase-related enzyme